MLAKRIIPCLDIKDGRTVKGVNFVDLRDAGDPVELAEIYGPGAILAGGLIVDGLHAFDSNLFKACDTAIGKLTGEVKMGSESLTLDRSQIATHIEKQLVVNESGISFSEKVDGIFITDINAVIASLEDLLQKKIDWVRRFKKFSNRHMAGDYEKTARCLKRVSALHKWELISRSQPIAWETIEWEEDYVDADSISAEGCYGGKCEI